MDYGLMIAVIVYCTAQYKKTKKPINLFLIIYAMYLGIYGTKYPIYNYLDKLQQNVENVAFALFTLGLLAIFLSIE